MRLPYATFDYVPWYSGRPQTGLVLLFKPRHIELWGIGIKPGEAFDIRAFADAFPQDVTVAWVFAEWIDALRSKLQERLTRDDVIAWLSDTAGSPFCLKAQGELEDPYELLSQLIQSRPLTRRLAMAALSYVVAEELAPGFEVHQEAVAVRGKPRPVLWIRTPDGELKANLWVERGPSTAPWQIFASRPENLVALSVTSLDSPSLRDALREFLPSQAASNCKFEG